MIGGRRGLFLAHHKAALMFSTLHSPPCNPSDMVRIPSTMPSHLEEASHDSRDVNIILHCGLEVKLL